MRAGARSLRRPVCVAGLLVEGGRPGQCGEYPDLARIGGMLVEDPRLVVIRGACKKRTILDIIIRLDQGFTGRADWYKLPGWIRFPNMGT